MQFPPSVYQIPCLQAKYSPQHLILGTPPVYSLRLGPKTTFHTHKKGLRVRNVEILNEASVMHSECRQLLFL